MIDKGDAVQQRKEIKADTKKFLDRYSVNDKVIVTIKKTRKGRWNGKKVRKAGTIVYISDIMVVVMFESYKKSFSYTDMFVTRHIEVERGTDAKLKQIANDKKSWDEEDI